MELTANGGVEMLVKGRDFSKNFRENIKKVKRVKMSTEMHVIHLKQMNLKQ